MAEGIISCLHCIGLSLRTVPAAERNRVSGNAVGVGIASRLTGVDSENASNVDNKEE